MQTLFRSALPLLLVSLFTFTGLSMTPEAAGAAAPAVRNAPAVNCPSVLLKHWRSSTQNEKLSFLLGFATMLEMEKEWQGSAPLGINQSITGSWVRGLSGVTLGQMANSVDRYAAEHPDQMDVSVIEVLGRIYVQPVLSDQERRQAGDHYRMLRPVR